MLLPHTGVERFGLRVTRGGVTGLVDGGRSRRDTGRAMSRENVDLVRSSVEAFNRQDARELAALCEEDVEIVFGLFTGVDAGGTPYRGTEFWPSYFARMNDTWEEWNLEEVEIFDAGDDQVAAVTGWSARDERVASLSSKRPAVHSPSATGRSRECVPTSTRPKPSKPWGCRSRRCRGRTWKPLGPPSTH